MMRSLPAFLLPRKIFENFSKSISVLTPILCDREVKGISSRAGTVSISRVHKWEVVDLCI